MRQGRGALALGPDSYWLFPSSLSGDPLASSLPYPSAQPEGVGSWLFHGEVYLP